MVVTGKSNSEIAEYLGLRDTYVVAEHGYEINCLKMGNKVLRDFLQLTEINLKNPKHLSF